MKRDPVLFFIVGFLFGWFAHNCENTAHADNRRSPQAQLILETAIVAAHEGAFENKKEVALIWQVVENRGKTVVERLAFLHAHSPRALGRKPCLRQRPDVMANCEWSVPLLQAPDADPPGFKENWWKAARKPLWQAIWRYARDLVTGKESWRPCPRAPWSWGYAGDIDGALERGLVPLGCEGVVQDGFERMSKTLSAEIARGRR